MAKSSNTDGVLAGLRVLDLTGPDGLLTGQILADLGADVVQAVPASRQNDSVGDYHWRAYTRGKRLLEFDPTDAPALNSLLAGADVLIESLSNAEAERLSLTPSQVAVRHPHLVHVSITPFGRTGPKADYVATDLTVGAASGYLFVSGAAGETPVRISVPQAHAHAGADAAVAVLIALRAKRGQHIDISAQHSMTLALLGRGLDAAVNQPRAERSSGSVMVGAVRVRSHLSGARRLGAGVGRHRAAGGGVHAQADGVGRRGKALRCRADRPGLGQRRAAHDAGLVQRGRLAGGRRRDRRFARVAHEV